MIEEITAEEYRALTAEKRTKYGNTIVVSEEGRFDSAGEHRRWEELKLLEREGAIRDLRRQVPYDLWVGEVKVCRYVADFVYWERAGLAFRGGVVEGWEKVVEDWKPGPRSRAYAIKKKLMLACFEIRIRETGR